jgi:uncharacterized membrane protein
MTDIFHTEEQFAAAPAHPEIPEIRKVALDAAYGWLEAGWRDMWVAPWISLGYGAIFAAFAYLAALQLTRFDALPLLLPAAFGFLLIGPVLASGLYEISRRNEAGEALSFRAIAGAEWRGRDQLACFGMLLFVLYFFWLDAALLLFMLFFGPYNFPPFNEFVSTLLLTPEGQGLLATGTLAGAAFAGVAFSISVIAAPMMFGRKVDTVTAMLASMRAVRKNLPAMALWAALIAAITAMGFVLLFAGLAVAFPLIGHASWHAYRELAPA